MATASPTGQSPPAEDGSPVSPTSANNASSATTATATTGDAGVVFDPRILTRARPALGAAAGSIRFGSMASDSDAGTDSAAAAPGVPAPAPAPAPGPPKTAAAVAAAAVPASVTPRPPMMYAAVTAPKPAPGNGAPAFAAVARAQPGVSVPPRVMSAPPTQVAAQQQQQQQKPKSPTDAPAASESALSASASQETAARPPSVAAEPGAKQPVAPSPTPNANAPVVLASAARSASPSTMPTGPSPQPTHPLPPPPHLQQQQQQQQQGVAPSYPLQQQQQYGGNQYLPRPQNQMGRPPMQQQQPYMGAPNRRMSNQNQMGPQQGMMPMPVMGMPGGQWAGQAAYMNYDPNYAAAYYQQPYQMNYGMYQQPVMNPNYQMRPPQQQMGPGGMAVRYQSPPQQQQQQQIPIPAGSMAPPTTSAGAPATGTTAGTTATFQLPRVSRGIKIVNPDTGEDVKLPAVVVKESAPPTPNPASATTSTPASTAPAAAAAPASTIPAPAASVAAARPVTPVAAPASTTPETLEAPKEDVAARSRSVSPLPAALPPRESKAIRIVRPEDAEKERKEKEAKLAAEAAAAKVSAEAEAPVPKEEPVVVVAKPEEKEEAKVEKAEVAAAAPEAPVAEVVGEALAQAEEPAAAEAPAPAKEPEAPVAAVEAQPAKAEDKASVEEPAKAEEPVKEAKTKEPEPAKEVESAPAVEEAAKEEETEKPKTAPAAAVVAAAEPKKVTQFVKPASFEAVEYPEGVAAPGKVNGIIRYERSFLLRFKDAKEKWERPEGLPPSEVIYEDAGSARAGSASVGRRPAGSTAGLPSRPGANPVARAPSAGLGPLKTSEERYAASKAAAGGNFLSSFGPRPGGLPGMGPRAQSSGGAAAGLGGRAASTSTRAQTTGRQRGEKGGRQGSQGGKSRKEMEMEAQFTIPLDQIKPLELSSSAWAPVQKKKVDLDEEDKIRRKLQGLLNKLSLEKFESISNQIMALGIDNESILALVIAGIFDKAVDEPNFGSMYARLCAKLSAELPKNRPWMLDEKDPTKNNLFRRLLLTKCQLEFEKGAKWSEIGKDREIKDVADMTLEEKQKLVEDEEKRQKMKRQALGNIRFIGEVFNLGMLGEKIMHACINQLLQDGAKNHGEEELESVCKLMATIGEKLDHPKAKAHMDEYFKVIKKLTTNHALTSRIRFALQDIVDLREKFHWKARSTQPAGPKTIAEIRQAAEQEAEEQAQNLRAAGRSGSGRGGFYGGGGGGGGGRNAREPSGRGGRESLAAAAARGAQARQTGDLSNFGKVTDSMASKRPGDVRLGPGASISFGAGARGWSKADGEGENRTPSPVPMSRQSSQGGSGASSIQTSMTNMFSALADTGDSRKKDEDMEAALPPSGASGKTPKGDIMSAEQAEKLGESAIKEFFGPESNVEELVRSWEEFSGPSDHKCDDDILDKWFSRAFDINFSKEDDPRVARFGQALAQMVSEKVMSQETLEKCLFRQAEMLEDLVPDAPKVYSIFGVIVAHLMLNQATSMTFLADICQPLVDSPSRVPQAPKLLKPFFDEILRTEPEAAPGLWEESELDLKSFWPGATGTDEAVSDWIKTNGFEAVFAGASAEDLSPAEGEEGVNPEEAQAELQQLLADAQADPSTVDAARLGALMEALSPEQLASEELVEGVVAAVVKNAAEQTSQAQPNPPDPTREHYAKQRDIVSQHQSSLSVLLNGDQPALRRRALSAIQGVCQELNYPSQFMAHMFRIFHELDILDDGTYEQWLKDETRAEELRQKAQAEVGSFVESLKS